jgi:6-oxo-cyclohex-1-ene-carbonyl-CoA hydrolase
MTMEFHSHELVDGYELSKVRYALRPIDDRQNKPVDGLYAAWITLDNEKQLNSYTTDMVKEVILAFRRASEARDVAAAFDDDARNAVELEFHRAFPFSR